MNLYAWKISFIFQMESEFIAVETDYTKALIVKGHAIRDISEEEDTCKLMDLLEKELI